MRPFALALPAVLASVLTAPAAAQEPTAPAAPAAPTLTIAAERDRTVLARSSFRASGALVGAAEGAQVVVRLYRRGRKVSARSVAVDENGAFRTRLKVRRSGRVVVRAAHRPAGQQRETVTPGIGLDVLPRRVTARQKGAPVRMLQRHLARRGYVVGRRGVFDARTSRAVLAFRKVTGMRRTSAADRGVMGRLARNGGWFRVRHPRHGKHVEADLSRQVLVLARGSKVERIYHTSTGSSATPTIRGSFRFYRSQPGLNSLEMFHTQYFIRGYAIHGYKSVPVYPASHGCLRVPMADARSIFNWIDLGNRIDVYR